MIKNFLEIFKIKNRSIYAKMAQVILTFSTKLTCGPKSFSTIKNHKETFNFKT